MCVASGMARSGDIPVVNTFGVFATRRSFDQVTLRAMRQWRFRRGPLIIELPLSFVLTKTRFSVYVPKYH